MDGPRPATAPAPLQASVTTLLDHFQQTDEQGRGLVDESVLVALFEDMGFSSVQEMLQASCCSVQEMPEATGCCRGKEVKYQQFLEWLLNDTAKPPPSRSPRNKPPLEHSTGKMLESIADSLLEIASSGKTDQEASSALTEHAASLRRICFTCVDAPSRPQSRAAADHPGEDAPPRPACRRESVIGTGTRNRRASVMKRMPEEATCIKVDARVQAAQVFERDGGCAKQVVDDLEEVAVDAVKRKQAIASWRGCDALRLYRSPMVTEALRLICSAGVPGLGETSYLDAFKSLKSDSGWEHHIYLFGGLVRDILRRKVGNDIDIAFTAPAVELEAICDRLGYQCSVDGDYILIGDDDGEEYLEGMIITHNGILPSYHADFSMNWVFYDFVNDLIVDKEGNAVQAILDNRCEIPCPRHQWDSWVDVNGSRVLFRYYKFLIRGYEYYDDQMAYVAGRLLAFWSNDAEETIEIGRMALGNLVSSEDASKIESLKRLVLRSFELGMSTVGSEAGQLSKKSRRGSIGHAPAPNPNGSAGFLSGQSWWKRGWVPLLKLDASC